MSDLKNHICHALDRISSERDLEERIEVLAPYVGCFKVGMELFAFLGPRVIEIIKKNRRQVFLDLKYYDIPHTVYQASKRVMDYGVDYLDFHAMGGQVMLEAAVRAKQELNSSTNLIAVTVLTSFDQTSLQEAIDSKKDVQELVAKFAKDAAAVGMDGIVCSADDLHSVHKINLPLDFKYLTPGLSFEDSQGSDQKRVVGAADAFKAGSSLLIMGRSLWTNDAKESQEKAQRLLEELKRCTLL